MITEQWFEKAVDAGTCTRAIIWMREEPRTWDELAREDPDWALWAAEALGVERLDSCAAAEPRAALWYAAARLSPERRTACEAAIAD